MYTSVWDCRFFSQTCFGAFVFCTFSVCVFLCFCSKLLMVLIALALACCVACADGATRLDMVPLVEMVDSPTMEATTTIVEAHVRKPNMLFYTLQYNSTRWWCNPLWFEMLERTDSYINPLVYLDENRALLRASDAQKIARDSNQMHDFDSHDTSHMHMHTRARAQHAHAHLGRGVAFGCLYRHQNGYSTHPTCNGGRHPLRYRCLLCNSRCCNGGCGCHHLHLGITSTIVHVHHRMHHPHSTQDCHQD